jgi:predicted PurR-regulated permease PerM
MHPLAVFAAIVGGGSLGGVLGMFLAIPIAASGKVILTEVVAHRLAQWADRQ